ncbi:MAG: PKD domain-containing protein [Bacteroidia bacterium]|nr:PKD domain-containing protein [Bacteroidia bacterium]
MKLKLAAILFILCFAMGAQQDNTWYFGYGAGLNFSTVPPTVLTNGQTGIVDNTSTMSDASGNLLFYSDGSTVWNKNHVIMPNGNGLIGHFSAGQCVIIIPIPCSATKYVIFHVTEYSNPGQLNYSVVDMSLNGGLGDVIATQKNISLGSGWTEKLCAYYNSAGNNYWLLVHKWNSDQFVAFNINSTSIATQSVVTPIGSVLSCGSFGGTHDAMGQLTISPDGTKVLNALTCLDKFELFEFNVTTGVLSNSISIVGNGGSAWGTAFSPDSKKIYTNSIFGQSVFQYNINTYTQAAIIASKVTLVTTGVAGYNFGYMELGPDGKVYIAKPNAAFMSVVNNPNVIGTGCGFATNGQTLGTKNSAWGTSRIAYNIPTATTGSFTSSFQKSDVNCFGGNNGSATISVSSSVTSGFSFSWTPAVTTSSVATNLIAGNYSVLVSNGACSSTTLQFSIVEPGAITINLNSPTLCKNQTGQLTPTISGGTPSFNYTWQPGNIMAPTINVNAQNFTYTLTVRDANNCMATAISQVNYSQVNAAFNHNFNPCNGLLNTSNTSFGATNFNWSFGDNSVSTQTNSQHTYSSSGNYSVQLIASNTNNCKDTVTKQITVPVIVKSAFTAQLPICDSVAVLTNASTGANSYLWRFGDGQTQTVSKGGTLTHTYTSSGNYTIWLVAINSSGCRDSVSYSVSCSKSSLADFDTGLNSCSRTVNFKNTSKWNQTNFWSFGTGITSTSVQPVYAYTSNGIYTVSLLINAGTSCSASITKSVQVTDTPEPTLNYLTSPCTGLVTFSNTTANSGAVIWTFGDGSFSTLNGPAHTYTRSGVYPVILTVSANQPCRKSATISVVVNFTPAIADFDFKTEVYSSSVSFINKSKNTTIWYWDFNDGTNSNLFEPTKTFGDYGTKLICLVAGNDKLCADTLCKYIQVENDWTLYVPNVFSPNGDGVNDVFYAYGTNIKNYRIKIFNRWGQIIFESGEFQKGWDGNYKAQVVQEDIYTWMIEFADLKGKSHSATGHVSVIR